MKTFVVANQKGGIGKTTTATALSAILNEKGKRTLLIDADMQCNSTDTYRAKYEGEITLYDVLFSDDEIADAVQHTEIGDIVPSDPLLRESEMKLGTDVSLVSVLKKKLKKLAGYDYVVIDTAPNLGNLMFSCLLAADSVIVPTTADRYSLQGLAQLKETLDKICYSFDKEVLIEGLLLVKFNGRMRLSRDIAEILDNVSKEFGTKLFKTRIRESAKAREAQALRKSLIEYAPKSTTAKDYYDFENELIGE